MKIPSTLRKGALAILLACSATLCLEARDSYTAGEKSFGPKVGFVTRNTSACAGLFFQNSFSRHVRISPQAGIIFRHHDLDALAIDLDVHFTLPFAGDKAAFYPIAGLGFTSWSRHNVNAGESKDVSTHINRLGVNAGAGIEFKCTSTLKLSFEAKYIVQKSFPQAAILAGIAYVF